MDRFFLLANELFKHNYQFAEKLGIAASSLSRIKKKGSMDMEVIDRLVKSYPDLNLNWFFKNIGNKWLNDEQMVEEPMPPYGKDLLEQLKEENKHLKDEISFLRDIIKQELQDEK
jgi:transcriptional regulator with XRE-family HTH domain